MSPLMFAFAAHPLVHLNAALNSLATVLLIVGMILIKRQQRVAHGRVMLAAFAVSALFLISYLAYHWLAGSVKFTYPGAVRYVYLFILLTHVLLAVAVPFLAVTTIYFALKGTSQSQAQTPEKQANYLAKHRRIARWTYPIWLYVSITGVLVYVMLYHLWPPVAS